jgi:transcription termination/antitermination protein NusG
MNWYALVVRPQHEKAVAASLAAKALDSYVPLYRDRRRWSDRVRILELPLFSRYVFCRCSFADRIKVLATPSVQSVVSFNGKPEPIPDVEIESIRTMIGSNLPIAPWECLRVGQRVRICDGPLTGVQGMLVRDKSLYRVVVNVELLQRAVAVEVDREVLKAADGGQFSLAGLNLPKAGLVPAC